MNQLNNLFRNQLTKKDPISMKKLRLLSHPWTPSSNYWAFQHLLKVNIIFQNKICGWRTLAEGHLPKKRELRLLQISHSPDCSCDTVASGESQDVRYAGPRPFQDLWRPIPWGPWKAIMNHQFAARQRSCQWVSLAPSLNRGKVGHQ